MGAKHDQNSEDVNFQILSSDYASNMSALLPGKYHIEMAISHSKSS